MYRKGLTCAKHGSQPHLVVGLPVLVDLLEEPCVIGTEVLEKTKAGIWERLSPERAMGVWGRGGAGHTRKRRYRDTKQAG